MQKLGIKDSLPGLLAIGFFLPSAAFVRRFFLCIFVPLILLFSVLFYVFFLYLFGDWDGRRQRCWSFYAQPVVTTSEDSKNDGHAGFGLCSFSFLLLMLSVEMMRAMVMKACYAGWVHAPASVFFYFRQCRCRLFLSLLFSLFFIFFLFFSFF